ncbi:hypothetical protein Tco_0753343 [Tanacetum coccineum]
MKIQPTNPPSPRPGIGSIYIKEWLAHGPILNAKGHESLLLNVLDNDVFIENQMLGDSDDDVIEDVSEDE